MYLKELEEIGLTQREIKVYISLLEIRLSSVGNIIKKSGIPGSKIYETLDKLKKRGLVSSIIKNNKKFFEASDPKTILGYLSEQSRKMSETVLPQLEAIQKSIKREREATIYEGISGIKSVYERMLRELKEEDTLYVLGAPLKAQQKLEDYLISFNKRRIKQQISMKIIYSEEAKGYGKIREKMKLTEVKYLKKELATPAWIDIFADQIVIFNISNVPTAVLIKDESVAKSFKSYFELMWRISKQ